MFIAQSDHQALRWIFTLREPKTRVARWLEILSAYDFSVECRRGQKHSNADATSRCLNPRQCECSEQDTLVPLKCGPCKKCRRRAEDMVSCWNIQNSSSKIRIVQTRSSAIESSPKVVDDAANTQNTRNNSNASWVPWKSKYSLKKLRNSAPRRG